jgi:hypothetical protein
MDWGQPTFVVTVVLLAVTVGLLVVTAVVPYRVSRKQSHDLHAIEQWKSRSDLLRQASDIAYEIQNTKLKAAWIGLVSTSQIRELNLSEDVDAIKRKLEPHLSTDPKLLAIVQNLQLHVQMFRMAATGDLDDFTLEIIQARRKYSPDMKMDDPALGSAFDWIRNLVFRGAEQRIAYEHLSDDLRDLQNALNDRMKR